MRRPLLVGQLQPDPIRPSAIEETRDALGKARRLDRIVEGLAKVEDPRVGTVGLRCRHKLAIRAE